MKQYLDAAWARNVDRICRKVDKIQGPGVSHAPDSITITPVRSSAGGSPGGGATGDRHIVIVGPADGDGYYQAVAFDPASDVVDVTVGYSRPSVSGSQFNAYAINLAELDGTGLGTASCSGHALQTTRKPIDDRGTFYGFADDGKPVYKVSIVQGAC